MSVWHEQGCSQPVTEQITGRRGDALESCPECRRYAVLEAVYELPPIPAAPQAFRVGWPTHKARRRLRAKRDLR
jgi:hypothetical protein